MGAYERFKAVATLGPIQAHVGLGFVICLQSAGAGPGRLRGLREMTGSLSRALLVPGVCLLGLAAIQVRVGFPLDAIG